MYNWLHRTWYEGGAAWRVLLPLSGVYWMLLLARRLLYTLGLLRRKQVAAPVIIVGNITAGGTGKTPVTIWLASELRNRGFVPGIASRGYGGSKSDTSMRVDSASDPAVVGDEPVLIAKRTGCPVVVDPDRARAASLLVDDGVNVVIADDGLQHHRLERNYEICVVDGLRGLGNRRLIPAGPLRETVDRLADVDQILINGRLKDKVEDLTVMEQNAIGFDLVAKEVRRINGSLTRPIERFAGTTVHGIAAIGHPQRFFNLLRHHGMQVIEHAYPDHARLEPGDLEFHDKFDVLMTEKDAVKMSALTGNRYWFVPVDLRMDPANSGPWLAQVESRLRSEQTRP